MKKSITLSLALILALSLAACDATNTQRGATTAAQTTSASSASDPSRTADPPDDDNFAFSEIADLVFEFSSGVGAWRTEVQICPDGTFSGYFSDSDMGEVGDGYPGGIVYECAFSGKFTAPEKTGEHEYTMKCVSLTQEGTVGAEKIMDGMKYITSEPYGFDSADEFKLYLPGKSLSDLPEAFLDWVRYSVEGSDELTFYGLYNVGGEMGFSSYMRMPEADEAIS